MKPHFVACAITLSLVPSLGFAEGGIQFIKPGDGIAALKERSVAEQTDDSANLFGFSKPKPEAEKVANVEVKRVQPVQRRTTPRRNTYSSSYSRY